MTASTAAQTPVVRRSAIEARHEALGATFMSDTDRWPRHYGDPDGERAAARDRAGIAEIGPFEELLLRGPGAADIAARLRGGTIPDRPTAFRGVALETGGVTGELWALGPDEILLVGPASGWAERMAGTLASADVSAIDMTGARTSLRLAGPAAPAVLSELCRVDTTLRTMAPAALIQASLAGVRAFIARLDADGAPGYTMMVSRDEAAYVWDSLREIGEAHGLVAVGPDAVAVDGGTR